MSFSEEQFEQFCDRQMSHSNRADVQDESNDRTPSVINQDAMFQAMQEMMRLNAKLLEMMSKQLCPPNTNETKTFNIVPDLSKTIDRFNGEKGPTSAKQWLEQIETSAKIHSWPEPITYETARSHLDGAAKYWYRGRCKDISDWVSFKEAFRSTFIFEESKTDLWKKMQRRTQHPNENVSQYFHEKVALCKALDLDFKETKEQVAIGLYSDKLSDFVSSRQHFDEDHLFKDIIMKERIDSARKGKGDKQPDRRTTFVRNEGSNVKKETKQASELKYYNCSETGHIKRNCPKPLRAKASCFSCGSTEHQLKSCPKMKTECAAPATSSTTAMLVENEEVPLLKKPYRVFVEFITMNISDNALFLHFRLR